MNIPRLRGRSFQNGKRANPSISPTTGPAEVASVCRGFSYHAHLTCISWSGCTVVYCASSAWSETHPNSLLICRPPEYEQTWDRILQPLNWQIFYKLSCPIEKSYPERENHVKLVVVFPLYILYTSIRKGPILKLGYVIHRETHYQTQSIAILSIATKYILQSRSTYIPTSTKTFRWIDDLPPLVVVLLDEVYWNTIFQGGVCTEDCVKMKITLMSWNIPRITKPASSQNI